MACLREPTPESFVLLTIKVAADENETVIIKRKMIKKKFFTKIK